MHAHTHTHTHTHTHRGEHYEENCQKSGVHMDDLLPGVIIEGVLGVDLKDCPGFKSQMDDRISTDSQEMRKIAQVDLYSGTPLKRTPLGPKILSFIAR